MRCRKAPGGERPPEAGVRLDDVDASRFRRYGSARRLYNFHVDNAGAY